MSDKRLITQEDKLEFLLAVIPYLHRRQDVTVRDVAQRFGVRLDDALQLINTLPMFGYPDLDLWDDPGTMFDTNDPLELEADSLIGLRAPSEDLVMAPRLSSQQVVALIMGLQQLESISADSPDMLKSLQDLGEKLSSGSQTPLEDIPQIVQEPSIQFFADIQSAISAEVAIRLDYVNAQGSQRLRTVFPVLMKNHQGNWLIIGYSLDHKEERIFRLDRIQKLSITEDLSPLDVELRQAILNNPQYSEGIFYHQRDNKIDVIFEVRDQNHTLLAGYYPKKISPNHYQITVEDVLTVCRIVSAFAPHVRIAEPKYVVDAVNEWTENTLHLYE